MEENWLKRLGNEVLTEQLRETNSYTNKFGLTLSEEEVQLIAAERANSLREQKRVEFGIGIMPKIIYEFCDSAYVSLDNYAETLIRLQDIFYLYKNEMLDEITDDELLHFMKEQFETVCSGDLDYLEGTCLNVFARAVRAGYSGFKAADGYGQYSRFDEIKRWDHELYREALKELFWR